MNEPIYEWMEYASEKLQNRLKPDIDVDDWMWGKTCFQFVLILNASSRERAYTTDPYSFYYRENDTFERNVYQQIDDWMEEELHRFFK